MDPSQLPKLPGYSFRDPTQTNHRKQQLFGVNAGSQIESRVFWQENVEPGVIDELKRSGTPLEAYRSGGAQPTTPKNKAIPRNPPSWLKYDRHVLRFTGYFQEAVHENPTEAFRVRNCTILHHLEDETTYVTEPKVENSGIPQGVFIKRHRIPRPQGGHFTWQDFSLGQNIDFYSRVFRVVDCDDFTRAFFAEQGAELGTPEAVQGDSFDRTRLLVNFKQPPPDTMDIKEYNEVKLGGGHPNHNLKSFIANDRRVLSFNIVWNDTSYDGGMKFFKLNYYLADGTMEILELRQANTGNETFPLMLKRMKVPKRPIVTHCPGLSLHSEEYYSVSDLMIGNTLHVYGRDVLLYDCDALTRCWFSENLGISQPSRPMPISKPYVASNAVPPYNGYGTEEDSLGNVYKLQNTAPKKDMYKMFDNDQHLLRFEAKLVSPNQEDEIRKFIVSFHPSDDSLKVYEVADRNSGIVGGSFLERRKYANSYTRDYYRDTDCFIGSTLVLQKYRLLLVKCDEYTHKYMEERPEKYPQADHGRILRKIMASGNIYQSPQHFLVNLLSKIDPALGKMVQFKHLLDATEGLGVKLTYQEEASLLRKWDKGNFVINVEEVYEELLNS